MQRSQLILLIIKKYIVSSSDINNILNLIIIIGPIILAIMYPFVGKLASYLGAFGSLVNVYIIPTFTYLK
jgi:hypothetical protein